ncbi:MAG TPA: addiction module antidote protein, HigA family [Acholeplasmatales bacterium]|nr:addiction module antidote protein, HigA family [Acholeplasmatales bacterium]
MNIMANIRRFHPGMYIKETLEAMEMTAREFSARTGIYERTLSAIINGNEDITFDIAYKLSLYFYNSVNYWTNLQNQYNLYTYEIESEKEL